MVINIAILGILPHFLLPGALSVTQEADYVPVTDPVVAEKLAQWQELKFGLFMHWGPYSQWGAEASWTICPGDWPFRFNERNQENYFEYLKAYESLAKTFNPLQFDPDKWAEAAQYAGMRYVVFTTKHHDGFCMYDTGETDYKVTDPSCPFSVHPKADITREVFDCFRRRGFWTGAYFSKADWHSNDFWWRRFPPFDQNVNYNPETHPEKWQNFVQFTHRQILEILSGYGPIDILWLDPQDVQPRSREEIIEYYRERVEKDQGFVIARLVNQDLDMEGLVNEAREIAPSLIVVDRFVGGEYENIITPENQVPEAVMHVPWESCITTTGSWSYTFNAAYMSSREVVHTLVDIVAKGGSLLLNIAPSPTGAWDDGIYTMLREVGDWMQVNSAAIYGTRPRSPYCQNNLRFTEKGPGECCLVYLAGEGEQELPREIRVDDFEIPASSKITLLGTPYDLKWRQDAATIWIAIPEDVAQHPPCKHAWIFRITQE